MLHLLIWKTVLIMSVTITMIIAIAIVFVYSIVAMVISMVGKLAKCMR